MRYRRPDEFLSFSKGDYFHVINRENDEEWYEACNPAIAGAQGFVPVELFETVGKNARDSGGSVNQQRIPDHDSGYSDQSAGRASVSGGIDKAGRRLTKSGPSIYGVVLYDFVAERPDELAAKEKESIIIIAQSNPEWFVAKPIGRLGGPGLIPVAFVEIYDSNTHQPVGDAQEAVRIARIPSVEEWKKMAAEYKNSSISLGRLEAANLYGMQPAGGGGANHARGQSVASVHNNYGYEHNYHQRSISVGGIPHDTRYVQESAPQMLAPVYASVPRYCSAAESYWFVVDVVMEDDSHWELCRYYSDFYDFQIQLLSKYPVEAGNAVNPETPTAEPIRTIPYMPGPVKMVTEQITKGRRENLDHYVKALLNLPQHIVKDPLVKKFFAPRRGDIQVDPYRLSDASEESSFDLSQAGSLQSSQNNLNEPGYGQGLSAPPPTYGAYHMDNTQSVYTGVAQPQQYHHPSDIRPDMLRQNSAFTQDSHGSQSVFHDQPTSSALKIKLRRNSEVIVLRTTKDITYQDLLEKTVDRFELDRGVAPELNYRLEIEPQVTEQGRLEDNCIYPSLDNDEQLQEVLHSLPKDAKLQVYVNARDRLPAADVHGAR
ncbi:hypothetical protein L228DRAFT_77310 [Xylona heveae TC161]|uniref:Uncharacterized protein n=1 Tax=Xylona heveae (strain CBS 132557 / TC161) TaxID=1328760 RepID=A0A165IWV8_XYLHT|nr:hypothetical protein L228DRAFT_77310 [Xylona heveae TC161]KZF25486.1 hypothetical protein L228DRAFT_77310 [Xylona heveae TC161]